MRLSSARQVWTEVYAFEVGQVFEFNLPDFSHDAPGVYCPSCRQHQTLKRCRIHSVKLNKTVEGFKCRSCGHECTRPAMLRRSGSVTATQTRSSGNSDYRIANGLEAGQIMSVIDSLPSPEKALGMWCYTDNSDRYESAVFEYIVDCIDQSVEVSGLGDARRVLVLVLLLMNDYRRRAMCGTGLYTDSALAEKLGVNRSQMVKARYWGKIKDKIIAIIDDMDRRALEPISIKIDKMRGSGSV